MTCFYEALRDVTNAVMCASPEPLEARKRFRWLTRKDSDPTTLLERLRRTRTDPKAQRDALIQALMRAFSTDETDNDRCYAAAFRETYRQLTSWKSQPTWSKEGDDIVAAVLALRADTTVSAAGNKPAPVDCAAGTPMLVYVLIESAQRTQQAAFMQHFRAAVADVYATNACIAAACEAVAYPERMTGALLQIVMLMPTLRGNANGDGALRVLAALYAGAHVGLDEEAEEEEEETPTHNEDPVTATLVSLKKRIENGSGCLTEMRQERNLYDGSIFDKIVTHAAFRSWPACVGAPPQTSPADGQLLRNSIDTLVHVIDGLRAGSVRLLSYSVCPDPHTPDAVNTYLSIEEPAGKLDK